MDSFAQLDSSEHTYYLVAFSALDRYFRYSHGENLYVAIEGGLIELARTVDRLEYPGVDGWDASAPLGRGAVYFRCLHDESPPRRMSFPILDFRYDPARGTFKDPSEAYRELRSAASPRYRADSAAVGTLSEAAVLAARYDYPFSVAELPAVEEIETVGPVEQRRLLIDLLGARNPERGFRLLHDAGFVAAVWPELARMDDVGHSKEHHPEGNVFEHTLESLRYRKTSDLLLGLGLLFHDVGKPVAQRTREKVFDGHAEIGADIARRFLERLGFPQQVTADVRWLVENHMYPGALHRLPAHRTNRLMESRLFPVLLELYRCDLSSTFRGPAGYYRACRIYRSFLKNVANPFRDAAGKKLVRLYVE
ncbi:MAG: HD domain-containing protein [Spirochaetaceae bacterium]